MVIGLKSYIAEELPLEDKMLYNNKTAIGVVIKHYNIKSHISCLTKYDIFFRELLLLSMTVSMGMLIFAGLGYAVEKDEPGTMFYTLPQTLYWAIITMTSTGKCCILFIRLCTRKL